MTQSNSQIWLVHSDFCGVVLMFSVCAVIVLLWCCIQCKQL